MNIKSFSIFLFILLFFLLILIVHHKRVHYNIENFASNAWTTNKEILAEEKAPLNDVQKKQVEDITTAVSKNTLSTLLASQSSGLVGPNGPPGDQGPAGAQYIAVGRLINKDGSFDKKTSNHNYFIPEKALSRSSGVSPKSSLAFMDAVSPFASFQNWELDVNNHLKNRFDDNCVSIDPSTKSDESSKIYMDKCDSNNQNQKWTWDSSNRIYNPNYSTSTTLRCLGLSKPEKNIITSIPGCTGENCNNNNVDKKYLVVKNCDLNKINDDELWAFI